VIGGGGLSSRRVFVYGAAVDMRKGYDGLYSLVRERLGRDPLAGDLFVFIGRDRLRAKVLGWDGTGLWIYSKRLEKGRFVRLGGGAGDAIELSGSELLLLLEGCKLIGKVSLSPSPCSQKDFRLSRS
jgi:transposase